MVVGETREFARRSADPRDRERGRSHFTRTTIVARMCGAASVSRARRFATTDIVLSRETPRCGVCYCCSWSWCRCCRRYCGHLKEESEPRDAARVGNSRETTARQSSASRRRPERERESERGSERICKDPRTFLVVVERHTRKILGSELVHSLPRSFALSPWSLARRGTASRSLSTTSIRND